MVVMYSDMLWSP